MNNPFVQLVKTRRNLANTGEQSPRNKDGSPSIPGCKRFLSCYPPDNLEISPSGGRGERGRKHLTGNIRETFLCSGSGFCPIGMTAWCERKSEGDEYSGSEMTRYRGHRKPLSLSGCHHSVFKQLHAYRERCPWLCRRIKKRKRKIEKLPPPFQERNDRKRKGKEIEATDGGASSSSNFLSRSTIFFAIEATTTK